MSTFTQILQENDYLDLKSHGTPVYYDLQPVTHCTYIPTNSNEIEANPINNMAMELVDSTTNSNPSKKRKKSTHYHGGSDLGTNDTGDDKSVRTDDNKKQNHSEIEKRRRDKMNTYIMELSSMIPMCHAMSRKLDKLTVLRMAVQHLKSIRGTVNSYTDGNCKPKFLTDIQLKQLILQAAEGFLFVVGCDRGRILYVSNSVTDTLNYAQSDLLGQSWFDILHPKDVAKVKEQLSSSDLSPRERLIDAKTMLPVKAEIPPGVSKLCPGARRSFFCRMKCKNTTNIKEEADTTTGCHRRKKHQSTDKKYRVIQCTGYLKSWPFGNGQNLTSDTGEESESGEGEIVSLSCLVAIGRILSTPIQNSNNQIKQHMEPLQYVSRHTIDGKFLFVDQRATLVLGFLPQELQGTSMYEYFNHNDICHLANSHKITLQSTTPIMTQVYGFRIKDGNFVNLQSEWRAFKNPWTKEIEYLIAKNFRIQTDVAQVESSVTQETVTEPLISTSSSDIDGRSVGPIGNNTILTRAITSQVEISHIGRHIADQVIDEQKRTLESPSTSNSISLNSPDVNESPVTSRNLFHDNVLLTNNSIQREPKTSSNSDDSTLFNSRNNVSLSSVVSEGEGGDEVIDMISGAVSPRHAPTSDTNDEAAMAVIMSLLEADAGLGGPVDFTGLPWPLT